MHNHICGNRVYVCLNGDCGLMWRLSACESHREMEFVYTIG